MSEEEHPLLQRLVSYPTPMAFACVQCWNALGREVFSKSVHHFAHITLALLHGLVLATRQFQEGRHTIGRESPVSLASRPVWKDPVEILRNWEDIRVFLDNSLIFPLLAEQKISFLDRFCNRVGVDRPCHFLEALGLLSTPAWIAFEEADFRDDRPVRSDPREVLQFIEATLADEALGFLGNWHFVVVLAPPEYPAEDTWEVVEFRGPYPVRKRMELQLRAAEIGQVYAYADSLPAFSLHPFALYSDASLAETEDTLEGIWLAEDLQLLENAEENRTPYRGVTSAAVTPRPNLSPSVQHARRRTLLALTEKWTQPRWGYLYLNLTQTRKWNNELGYTRVNEILLAMDKVTAGFSTEVTEECGPPRIFPFWRHGDALLMPLYYDAILHPPPHLWIAAADVVSRILLAGAKLFPSGEIPTFFAALGLDVWSPAEEQQLDYAILTQVEEALSQLKILRSHVNLNDAFTLWIKREGLETPWHFRKDPLFERISQAAFGLLHRQGPSGAEFLLRWNRKHGGFNFVGGHQDIQDGGRFENTLKRELIEELGLASDSYTFEPLFDAPLRTVRISEGRNAMTCYTHQYYLVHPMAEQDYDQRSDEPCKWVGIDELSQGRTHQGDKIQDFPFNLLADTLVRLDSVKLPFSALEHLREQWKAVIK